MKKGNNLSLRDMYDMLSGTLQGVREDRARVKAINAELVEALASLEWFLVALLEGDFDHAWGKKAARNCEDALAALKKARDKND